MNTATRSNLRKSDWNDRYTMTLRDEPTGRNASELVDEGSGNGQARPSASSPTDVSNAGRPVLEIVVTASFDLMLRGSSAAG